MRLAGLCHRMNTRAPWAAHMAAALGVDLLTDPWGSASGWPRLSLWRAVLLPPGKLTLPLWGPGTSRPKPACRLIGGILCAGGIPLGGRHCAARVRLAQLPRGAHWLREEPGPWDKLDQGGSHVPAVLQRRGGRRTPRVFRYAAMEVVREQPAAWSQGEVALASFLRQFAQGVAAFVSDCYAECQALGVDSEADLARVLQGLLVLPVPRTAQAATRWGSSLFLPVCLRCHLGCWFLGG